MHTCVHLQYLAKEKRGKICLLIILPMLEQTSFNVGEAWLKDFLEFNAYLWDLQEKLYVPSDTSVDSVKTSAD